MDINQFGRPPYLYPTAPPTALPAAPQSAHQTAHLGVHPSAHHGYQTPTYHTPTIGPLAPQACALIIRQQPSEALVTLDGKEKTRKPVDPPPILELTVSKTEDPHEVFLQNPYIFVCVKLIKAERDEAVQSSGDKALTGTLVSSLHRLKDINNKDGGFFVFGDISVRVQGTYRLHFSLYEFDPSRFQVQQLATISSDKFKVLQPKDFKGMDESTYLSRAFSDQGVRLRLRKEPRGVLGNKRAYPFSESPNTPIRPNNATEYAAPYQQQETMGSNKRFKSDPEDRKDSIPTLPVSFRRQSSMPTPYPMPSYSPLNSASYGMATSGVQNSYPLAPSMPSALYNSSSPTYYNTNGTTSSVDQSNFYPQFPDHTYTSQGGLGL